MKFLQMVLLACALLATASAALACETPMADSCPLGGLCGPCGSGAKDNLAGAAFGVAMVAGSVYWKRRAAKTRQAPRDV